MKLKMLKGEYVVVKLYNKSEKYCSRLVPYFCMSYGNLFNIKTNKGIIVR